MYSENNFTDLKTSKKIPSDCPICASRPALYLYLFNVTHAHFYCKHTNNSSKTYFKPSKTLKFMNILFCFVLLLGIFNDIYGINRNITIKHLFLIVESIFNFSTILVNLLCLLKNDLKIKEVHGLITIIKKKAIFGINEVISSQAATRIHNVLLFTVFVWFFEEVLSFCRNLIIENLEYSLIFRMVAIEILIICNASIGLYVVEFLNLYKIMFNKCYEELKECLHGIEIYHNFIPNKKCDFIQKSNLIKKLQKIQRFYLCLQRNFKLNEAFIQPGCLIIYTVINCILLISYSYLVTLYVAQELNLLQFDLYVAIKSSAIVLTFGFFCYQAQQLHIKNQKILSFVFKCPISKLTLQEAAQIELIVQTFNLQKPDLRASNIFIVGTKLIASVCGTVVTYALVALQFHALLSKE